jgi:hypothetical protein
LVLPLLLLLVLEGLEAHRVMEQVGLILRLWAAQQLLVLAAAVAAGLIMLGQMVALAAALVLDTLVLVQAVQELQDKEMLVEHLSQIHQPHILLLVEAALVLLV